MSRFHLFAVILALGAVGAARAEPVKSADSLSSLIRIDARSLLAQPVGPSPLAYARSVKPRREGVTQTSVERRFGVRDDAVGEAGFLCGLLPHPDTSGAAAAYGHDPDGRFVGAKLRLAF